MKGDDSITPAAQGQDIKGRVISGAVLVLFLITVWFMLDLVLLTFVITFVGYYLMRLVRRIIAKTPLAAMPDGAILIIVCVFGLGIVFLCSVAFTPVLLEQTADIAKAFIRFDFDSVRKSMDPRLAEMIGDLNIESYIASAGNLLLTGIMNVGKFGLNLLLSLALSFLLLLEKKKIAKFGEVLGKSRIAFIYHHFIVFGLNFCRTFAKVMKVQITIAFINSILSIIILACLGFPNIWGLGVMIFVLGLIPVAGVIISLIPLSIIAFNTGGLFKVIEILIMVLVIHAIEAYILNPKLMANRTSLPVSFVFIILLVSEKYLHVWGLLIGVPLFIFLLAIFDVDYEDACKPTKIISAGAIKRRRRDKKREKTSDDRSSGT
ncbi:MAG: AI-2E family transporter [Clostridiales Family XIII bacterium]|jgi:predicted PurR-regulated permease PerM|nr:AI-2E family transporter [Clostridiales Family XIII bacterium]